MRAKITAANGLTWLALGAGVMACSAPPLVLRPPSCSMNPARDAATSVELDPIVLAPGADHGAFVAMGRTTFARPGPADVLTAAITSELDARALRGGEPGGYVAKCTLERFAVRSDFVVTGSRGTLVLYADAQCEVERRADHAAVWRGMLRGRAAARGAGEIFSPDEPVEQRLTDRVFSDASREMASDLAVRVLGLTSAASARVFGNDATRAKAAGLDDGEVGALALAEDPRAQSRVNAGLSEREPITRASSWNVLAMTAGPGEPLPFRLPLQHDPDPLVRFVQYKALARAASPESLAALKAVAAHEDQSMLVEFANDALATGGIGVARVRTANASIVTNGTTTRP